MIQPRKGEKESGGIGDIGRVEVFGGGGQVERNEWQRGGNR